MEDEFLIALDLTLVLERQGWAVLGPVASSKAALRLLDQETPTVAVLDLNLADGPATMVAEALRARNVPFVVASANSLPHVAKEDVFQGVINVGKPTREHRLIEALKHSLDNRMP